MVKMNLHELDSDYEILGELGRGGTSIVYHARERELGRDVAIKVVRPSHADDQEAAARLAREAKLVAMLRHPNIVPLLSVRRLQDGGLALVMQHVPGRTLKRAIREEGPLPVATAEHVLREIASALEYAHKRHGIIHRDIKPENIYLDEEVGRALLADFGIARTTESESNLTLVGTALGTPAYMSPEQIDGTTLDGRSDFYSLGLVAHEMLTGQQPWAGNNLYTIIYKQKNEELPPISSFRQDVPVYLQRAVESLLRKDPDTRCGDAASLLAQLPAVGAALDLTPSPSRPTAVPDGPFEDDAPTIRYKRSDVAIPDAVVAAINDPAVLPDPVPPSQPVVAATTSVAAVVEDTTAAQVIELPKVRPNWQRNVPRGRGGLKPGGAFTAVEDVTPEIPAPAPRRKGMRLVAGITIGLILSASATVVAMRNVRLSADDDRSNSTEREVPESLLKAAVTPALLESAPKLNEAATAEPQPASTSSTNNNTTSVASKPAVTSSATAEKPAQTVEPPSLRLPTVNVPDVSVNPTRRINEADFTRITTPKSSMDEVPNTPAFTPHTVRPELRNRSQVQRVLSDEYPAILRERGVGGTVRLWVLIDTAGKVVRSELNQSSGNPMLDRAAERVAGAMQFTPAMNRDRRVSVWIQVPVIFRTEN